MGMFEELVKFSDSRITYIHWTNRIITNEETNLKEIQVVGHLGEPKN